MSEALDLPPESTIGRYRVERLLGRGAMGRVLLARDRVLEREVAVKVLRDDLGLEPEQRASLQSRMRQEAKACARVTHPHIVQLFDMGEEPGVGLYLVFEHASGTTLKARLKQGPLPASAVAELAREVGDALSTAHESGILHRDIKPENIMLTAHGSKVADFGIARVPDSTLTKNGGLLGTPAYSAPECIAHGEFSAKSDQFSLAATLYEALARKRAFPGDDAVSVATRIQNDEPPGIAASCGLDEHVDGVLFRALSKDPEARFPSTREFGDALAEALGRHSRTAMPTLPDERHVLVRRAEVQSGPRLFAGGLALGVLLGAALLGLTRGLYERERAALTEKAAVATPALAWLSDGPAPSARPAATVSARRTPLPSARATLPGKPAPSASPASEEPRLAAADAGANRDGDAGP